MLQGSQARSIESQRRKQSGLRNLTNAAMRFAMAGAGNDKNEETTTTTTTPTSDTTKTPLVDFLTDPDMMNIVGTKARDLTGSGYSVDDVLGFKERGGAVEGKRIMKTPGEFSHSTNPIDIMREGKKIGEMTGGEFVINPDQANGMNQAYEKVKKNPTQANLMELFEAVRFLDEPQFD